MPSPSNMMGKTNTQVSAGHHLFDQTRTSGTTMKSKASTGQISVRASNYTTTSSQA